MIDRLYQNPAGLLIYTGTLFGLTFPLGKIASQAGVPPIVWAMVISFGAVLFIAPDLIRRQDFQIPRGQVLRYVVISGSVSFALVNVMIFVLIPHLGAGRVALMFALSPVFTLGLSVLFRLKGTSPLGVLGIGLGLIGASAVAMGRGDLTAGARIWGLLGITLPMLLAAGNIYRTLDWPEGAHPATLAFWSQTAAFAALLVVSAVGNGAVPLVQLTEVPWVTLVQLIAAALIFPAYFRLQKLGGPLLLSQTGYVAAAAGLFSGSVFLGEVYALSTWAGAGMIALGIAFTILAQSQVSLRQRQV